MSIEIDFNNLKYNLYEILNVKDDDNDKIIKKKFMTLIKIFHPDKNNKLEEDIYQHIILANQILLNKKNREKYDIYLKNSADTFVELKNKFNKDNNNINNDNDNDNFLLNCNKLNKLHGYSDFNDNDNVNDKLKNIIEIRKNIDTNENIIKNMDEFNNKFNELKNNTTNNNIIETEQDYNLETYNSENIYTTINNLDKLYINDSVQTNKYTSIDRAFILQPVFKYDNDDKTLEKKIDEYTLQSTILKDSIKNKIINLS
jgi:curved DNA-binding protein CbpA